MTKTLQELIDESIFLSTEYQAVLAELSQGADWDVDFSAPSFTLQTDPPVTLTPHLLGTESASRGSWIWCWQELGHFSPEVVAAAVQAKHAGERLEVRELSTDEQPLEDGLARRLTLAAKAVTGLYAHYPARAGGNITAWLLLEGPQFELPRLSEQRMMQVIGESLTTGTAQDHNAAVASYARLRGAHVEWDTDATCVVTVHDGAQRFWFDEHQITGVEPAEPVVGDAQLRELEAQAADRLRALREDRAEAARAAAELGRQQREDAQAEREQQAREREQQRREAEREHAPAQAPVSSDVTAQTASETEQPLPEELTREQIDAPEPEQPAGDVAAADPRADGDRPFDQEPTAEPTEQGRVETRVLPGPQTQDHAPAGPQSSPHPDTTAMARIPDPDFAAAQPGAPLGAPERAVEADEPAVAESPERTADRVQEPLAGTGAAEPQRPAGERSTGEPTEHVVERETVAGPDAEHEVSAPAVVDGQEVPTEEQEQAREGKKKKGFLSRFFGM